MLALLLSQNVLEKCWGTFCKRNNLSERKHKQETNIRQHNATLGHNEQDTHIEKKPNEKWTCLTA